MRYLPLTSRAVKLIYLFLFALVSTVGALRAENFDLTWMRLPEATVPQMAQPPKIDGNVDRHEWLGATELGLMAVNTDGVDDGLKRRVFMGYDQERLYLAVQIERPDNAPPASAPADTGRVDSARGGDFFEAAFTPGRVLDKSFAFVLYPNGAFGDAKNSASKDFSWDAAGLQTAAHLTDHGWEGELSVPWSDLGLSGPPPPGESWGFDAVDNRNVPATLLGHWSFRGGLWKNYQNYGTIRFEPAPAVRLGQIGQIGNQRFGADFSVVNLSSGTAPVAAHFELRRRRAGAAGGPTSFLENIESGMGQDAQAEFTKGTKLPDQVQFALKYYDLVGSPKDEKLDIPPGEQRSFGLNEQVDLGEYLLAYSFSSGGKVLERGSSVVRLQPPLPIRLEPYWLYSEVVDVVLEDFSRIDVPAGAKAQIKLFQPDHPEKTLAQAELPIPKGAKNLKIPLNVKGLAPGPYKITTSVAAPDGKIIASLDAPLQRPEFPAWYKNDFGNRIEVPKPWTPIQATPAGIVKVWNRTYDLSTLLPRSILCSGTEILASPVDFEATIDGRLQHFKVDSLKLAQAKPGKVVYDASLTSEEATLKGTATVEFDGFIWYDLVLAPKSPGFKLGPVMLDAKIRPEYSVLFSRHKFLEDDAFPAPKPEKNGEPGIVQDSLFPFTPLVWIGKEEGGLIFSAENMQDWAVDRPNAVLETCAPLNGGPSAMKIHFVQQPIPFDRPRRFQFSLQGTPIREALQDYRKLAIRQFIGVVDDEEELRQTAEAGVKTIIFYYGWRGDPKTEMGGTPERPVIPGQSDKLKHAVEIAHKYGMKVIMFTGWGINAVSPNWQKYGYELAKYPINNNGWGTYSNSPGLNGGYADFMAWSHADLAKTYGVDGVLYDSLANLAPDTNLRIGNGWVDDQGRVHPGYAVRATREVFRRVYTVYEGEERPEGFIYNHVGSMWNINVYADVINRGEGQPMRAETLRGSWTPLEQYRAEYSGEPFGLAISNEQNDHKKLPMSVNNHNSVTLLHGTFPKVGRIPDKATDATYERYHRPDLKLWALYQWLPMDGTEKKFLYYRKQQAVLPENPALLSSAFVSPDGKRAIVVVSNLDKAELKDQKVRLDFKAMGMVPGPYQVQDGVLDEKVPLDGDTVHLDILDERYRLLKIEAGPEKTAAAQ